MIHGAEAVSLLERAKERGLNTAIETCGFFDSSYIEDLAEAVVRLALCEEPLMADGAGGYVYNLAGAPEDTRVLREFVEKMRERCGGKGRLVFGVRPPNAEGVVSLDPDISKICRVSGWTPQVRFEEGIDRIIGKT